MRSTVSEKGIRYFLDEVDWSRINLSEFDSGKKGSVIDALTEALNNSLKSERFTSADVETLISSPSIKTFLSREIGELAGDLKTGRSTASVTKEEIGQLVEENWALFEPVFTAEVEPEITKTVDDAAAGKMDPGFRKEILAFSKRYSTDQKYARMLKEIEESGNIRKEDRDLLYDFVKNEYFVRMFKANLSSFIPDEMTKQLSTAYLRSQLPEDQAGLINTALSTLPYIFWQTDASSGMPSSGSARCSSPSCSLWQSPASVLPCSLKACCVSSKAAILRAIFPEPLPASI